MRRAALRVTDCKSMLQAAPNSQFAALNSSARTVHRAALDLGATVLRLFSPGLSRNENRDDWTLPHSSIADWDHVRNAVLAGLIQ